MVDAIVSALLQPLISITIEEIQEEVKLFAGVENEVIKLKSNLQSIQAVLLDAEEIQVNERAARLWLDRLRHISYDVEDVLDKWNTAIMKMRMEGGHGNAVSVPDKKVRFFFPCHCFGTKEAALRHDTAHKIKELNEKLDDIAREKDRYNLNGVRKIESTTQRVKSTSLIDDSEIYGRGDIENTLLNNLLCDNSDEKKGLHIISIVGMGGIGKTTLAQIVFNKVKSNFDKAIWVCVSNPFNEFKVAKAIIDCLNKGSFNTQNLGELETLMQCICESITNKKILLVLDDVWTEDYNKWRPFELCLNCAADGSKILITTRKENVTHMMKSNDVITINELTEEHSWLLFKRIAFFGRLDDECNKLEDIGWNIVGKCKGLPLAVKTIGSLLRFRKTRREWQQILNSETWKLEKFGEDVFNPLLLSYNDLPSMVKYCFLYCSIFPKGFIIYKDELIKLWMAQGYLELDQNMDQMENIGEEYFNQLATRSFFQEFVKDENDNIISFKMHDIIHDFAQSLNKNEHFIMELCDDKEPSIYPLQQEAVRHSMVIGCDSEYLKFIFSFRKLRSLVLGISRMYSTGNPSTQQLFDELTCLRALSMRGYYGFLNVKMIPNEIKNLMHLRYLNLNGYRFPSLPEALCELYNLQTLDISRSGLLELPQGIGKLINLRHLLNNDTIWLRYLPMGIERLTCLRTLSEFVVSVDDGDNKACTLTSLNNLNHLCGNLKIRGLGRLSDIGEGKLFQVQMSGSILNLDFDFSDYDKSFESSQWMRMCAYNKDEELLEALRPHPNLEELVINYYRGSTVSPSWIMSLNNLRKLYLNWCKNCKHLSPLGKLPFLESLTLNGDIGGTKADNEFWGIETDAITSSLVFFPSLKYLKIWGTKWEKWNCEVAREGETNITIMPSLVSFELYMCNELKIVPDILLKNLKELSIIECYLLQKSYDDKTGDDWPKISHIPSIKFW